MKRLNTLLGFFLSGSDNILLLIWKQRLQMWVDDNVSKGRNRDLGFASNVKNVISLCFLNMCLPLQVCACVF